MKALVVNCSLRYNVGAAKLADWLRAQGHDVTVADRDPGMFATGYDLVALSVIFSWHARVARDIALRVKANSDVWAGGPGLYALASWWKRETGLECHRGLDWRFERQRGTYERTFASRGCPVGCSFCLVPAMEGRTFTLDWDFQPAPILCDNNLSALPVDFQEHIIQRYQETGTRLLDAQSGFEPASFAVDTFFRWTRILEGPWRLALDEIGEMDNTEYCLSVLRDYSPRDKQVYVLAGNEPLEACYERAQKVIEWGAEPYVQPYIALNALVRRPRVAHDWTEQKLRDFARYYNRHLWRKVPLREYRPRKHEPAPFAAVR